MYWLTAKNVVVSVPRWRSLALLLRFPVNRRSLTLSPPLLTRQCERIHCFKERKVLKGTTKSFISTFIEVEYYFDSLKEGTLNWEMLQFKSKFPREVLLCRVGDFYEAIGIDACILVEYAGLNPFGGLRSDSIPRAGCPVVGFSLAKFSG
ncbi:hypothetical protein F0562_000572 [Nyssa sinensis]|uniref:DNA mismatch repair protein MutS-like N-terminal domain-containing protein n=1 Tax=Nyssa sinensis TaxID=561372 RepID=A0A5J5C0U7_9ASTE|nr:hypothetical protein F0562_000572 [Nyssa sinensis]